MGANLSIATATAVANISANTVVNSSETCAANQSVAFGPLQVTIANISCGQINIGGKTVQQNATCNNAQQIAVISKIVADQTAKTNSSTGLGFLNAAIAESDTFIDMQNNIAAYMSASCANNQLITVQTQVYTIGNITGQQCNIAASGFSQQSSCINNIQAQIQNSNQLTQTAEATATAGVDLGELLAFAVIVLLILAAIFIGIPFLGAAMTGKGIKDVLTGKGGTDSSPSLPDLRARMLQLRRAVTAIKERQAAMGIAM